MLEVKNLKKSYGDIKALNGISFLVEEGQVFGLLGPNGAGKTTTFNLIATLLKPDTGNILWEGKSIFENKTAWRKSMGFVPQHLAVYKELTAFENIMLMASLYGLKGKEAKERCIYLLEKIGLKERMNDKVNSFSGGMVRRLNLVMGLVHNPDIILLDEPTAGIDVQTKHKIYEFIRELTSKRKTVLYTTHLLKEAEELFDTVAIIDEGEIKAIGKVEDLVSKHAPSIILELTLSDFDGKEISISDLGQVKDNVLKTEIDSREKIAPVIEELISRGIEVKSIKIKGASLETVFLNLTGKELRD